MQECSRPPEQVLVVYRAAERVRTEHGSFIQSSLSLICVYTVHVCVCLCPYCYVCLDHENNPRPSVVLGENIRDIYFQAGIIT